MSGRIVVDDADFPAVEGGRYVIAYGEMVDGYRHAYADPDSRRGRRRGKVRYSRKAGHPADPCCPECNP